MEYDSDLVFKFSGTKAFEGNQLRLVQQKVPHKFRLSSIQGHVKWKNNASDASFSLVLQCPETQKEEKELTLVEYKCRAPQDGTTDTQPCEKAYEKDGLKAKVNWSHNVTAEGTTMTQFEFELDQDNHLWKLFEEGSTVSDFYAPIGILILHQTNILQVSI